MPVTNAAPAVGSNWDADQAPEPAAESPAGRRRRQTLVLGAVVVALVVVTGVAVALLEGRNRSTVGSVAAPSAATQQAEDWVVNNVSAPQRLVVDPAVQQDLLRFGWTEDQAVPASAALTTTDDWRNFQYVIATEAIRRDAAARPEVQAALDTSVPVAVFGAAADRVEVRRLVPQGMVAVTQAQDAARAVRLQAGASLSGNAALTLSPDAVDEIRTGQVDERLLNVLATLAAQHDLQVADFPAVAGEEGVGAPRRTVEIDSIDFRPVTDGSAEVASIAAFLDRQLAAYRPVAVEVETRDGGNASLRITYSHRDPGALGG